MLQRVKGHRIGLVLIVVLAVAIIAPMAAIAAGGAFTDDDTSIFEGDIEWMAANGVTAGCNPPANDHYCPSDAVTRGQMAAFMHRLAVNEVVDAADSALLEGQPGGYYENKVWANNVTFGLMPDSFDGTNQQMAEFGVQAPTDGYLLVNASSSVYDPDSSEQSLWWVQIDESTCHNASPYTDSVAYGYVTTPGSNHRQSIALTGVAEVAAGAHTVTLCARGTADNTTSYQPSVTALFTALGEIQP
jgi:hypothetical protein